MRQIKVRRMVFTLIILLLTSCLSKKDTTFAYEVPIGDMNSSIKLEIWNPEGMSRLVIGNKVSLALSNKSYYDISFPKGYGFFILSYNEDTGEWKDIPNEIEYSIPVGELSLMERGSKDVEVQILPKIENNNQAVEIRVVVIGKTAANPIPNNKDVGAYIDLTLQP
jgi:hypothetical protein